MVHLWAFLEPRSSSGSELIFVLSEGVGVRRKIVFNGCEFERDAQECQTLFHPLSLSPLFSCVDEYVVFFPSCFKFRRQKKGKYNKTHMIAYF